MNAAFANPTIEAHTELQAAFDHYNERLFGGELPHCLITMQREKHTYGYFSSKRFVHRIEKRTTDEIAINPAFFAVSPTIEILQTIAHEMVHQWQYHFGKPTRRGYHNREWAEKMEAIGLMPSDTGQPGGRRTGQKMADYPIEGGLFLAATADLLAGGFRISWLDRHPYQRPGTPPPVSAPAVPPGSVVISGASETTSTPVGGRGAPNTEVTALASSLGDVLAPIPPANRSNRIKYRCPSCGAQAWGKPSLRLLCGADGCEEAALQPAG